MGSIEPLSNGNEFVGLGIVALVHRVQLLGADAPRRAPPGLRHQLPGDRRAVGRAAAYPPAGAARRQNGKTTVYASWNGATELASWRVLGVSSAGATNTLASAPKSGFETAIPAAQGYTRFEVQALNSAGRVIGTSQPFSATG